MVMHEGGGATTMMMMVVVTTTLAVVIKIVALAHICSLSWHLTIWWDSGAVCLSVCLSVSVMMVLNYLPPP